MSIKYTNLTYNELMELAPKDKPFQVVVQSNPFGKGGEQTLWACLDNTEEHINTEFFGQTCIDGIEYGFLGAYNPDTRKHVGVWQDQYKGTFDLIVHHLDDTTLEQYQVGDEVEVLEKTNLKIIKALFIIKKVIEHDCSEPDYIFGSRCSDIKQCFKLPHNCLRKVVSKKNPPQTITIGKDTFEVTEELTNVLKNLKKLN